MGLGLVATSINQNYQIFQFTQSAINANFLLVQQFQLLVYWKFNYLQLQFQCVKINVI